MSEAHTRLEQLDAGLAVVDTYQKVLHTFEVESHALRAFEAWAYRALLGTLIEYTEKVNRVFMALEGGQEGPIGDVGMLMYEITQKFEDLNESIMDISAELVWEGDGDPAIPPTDVRVDDMMGALVTRILMLSNHLDLEIGEYEIERNIQNAIEGNGKVNHDAS